MSPVLRSLALAATLLGLGLAAGWRLRGTSSTSTREPSPASPSGRPEAEAGARTPAPVVVQAVDPNTLRAAVRQAVGEELAAARAADDAETVAATAASAAAAAPDADTLVAVDSGHRYIEGALGSGHWGAGQVSHLRELGVGLNAEQYQEMIRPLAIAINEGRVQVDVDGPAF